jgi:hypothetical protein
VSNACNITQAHLWQVIRLDIKFMNYLNGTYHAEAAELSGIETLRTLNLKCPFLQRLMAF